MIDDFDWGIAFNLLADKHRRRLLVSLLEHNPQDEWVSVPEDIHMSDEELDVLQNEFVHVHLPKLEASGYIRWDQESHEIIKGPDFSEIRPLLELIHNHRNELPEGWL